MDHLYQILDFSISIFTAILGIAYPLLLENMNTIDEKYHSAKITERLVRNTVIRRFDWVVVVCIIETVCFPLIILSLNGRYASCSLVIIMIHILTTFALMIGMIAIVRLIRLYNNAQELSQLLSDADNQQDKLENIDLLFDISMYLSKIKNTEQMYTVMSRIYKTISDEIVSHPKTLSKEVRSVIQRIFKASTFNSDGNLYFLQDGLTPILYNEFDNKLISNEQYRLIWYGVLQIVKAGNFRWFQQYWIYASQYGDHLLSNREIGQEQISDFVFEQIMLGASLLYYERYDWLNFIFYYSSVSPPIYNSIPSSLGLVWHYEKILERKIDGITVLERDYNFLDIDNGVSNDNTIGDKALEYLALLLVRLLTLPNISYIDIFDIPEEDITRQDQILMYKNYVDALKSKLDVFPDRTLRKIFKYKYPKNWRERLNTKLMKMLDNFKLSDEVKRDNETKAIQEIKEKLKSQKEQLNLKDVPLSDSIPSDGDLLICSVGVGDNLKNTDQFIGDSVPTGIIDQLKRQKLFKYLLTFHFGQLQKKFLIRNFDIEETLNKLRVRDSDDFFTIFTGTFNEKELPLETNRLYIPSNKSMILICKKNDLPKITQNIPEKEPVKYKKIADNLFFNFDRKKKEISVATYFGVEKNPKIQYVLININMSVYTDKFDLDKVQDIHQLLCKCPK
jgi:hypothetical protein